MYVGNLSWNTTWHSLKDHFKQVRGYGRLMPYSFLIKINVYLQGAYIGTVATRGGNLGHVTFLPANQSPRFPYMLGGRFVDRI